MWTEINPDNLQLGQEYLMCNMVAGRPTRRLYIVYKGQLDYATHVWSIDTLDLESSDIPHGTIVLEK